MLKILTFLIFLLSWRPANHQWTTTVGLPPTTRHRNSVSWPPTTHTPGASMLTLKGGTEKQKSWHHLTNFLFSFVILFFCVSLNRWTVVCRHFLPSARGVLEGNSYWYCDFFGFWYPYSSLLYMIQVFFLCVFVCLLAKLTCVFRLVKY